MGEFIKDLTDKKFLNNIVLNANDNNNALLGNNCLLRPEINLSKHFVFLILKNSITNSTIQITII